jgi:hypothetical protein
MFRPELAEKTRYIFLYAMHLLYKSCSVRDKIKIKRTYQNCYAMRTFPNLLNLDWRGIVCNVHRLWAQALHICCVVPREHYIKITVLFVFLRSASANQRHNKFDRPYLPNIIRDCVLLTCFTKTFLRFTLQLNLCTKHLSSWKENWIAVVDQPVSFIPALILKLISSTIF